MAPRHGDTASKLWGLSLQPGPKNLWISTYEIRVYDNYTAQSLLTLKTATVDGVHTRKDGFFECIFRRHAEKMIITVLTPLSSSCRWAGWLKLQFLLLPLQLHACRTHSSIVLVLNDSLQFARTTSRERKEIRRNFLIRRKCAEPRLESACQTTPAPAFVLVPRRPCAEVPVDSAEANWRSASGPLAELLLPYGRRLRRGGKTVCADDTETFELHTDGRTR